MSLLRREAKAGKRQRQSRNSKGYALAKAAFDLIFDHKCGELTILAIFFDESMVLHCSSPCKMRAGRLSFQFAYTES